MVQLRWSGRVGPGTTSPSQGQSHGSSLRRCFVPTNHSVLLFPGGRNWLGRSDLPPCSTELPASSLLWGSPTLKLLPGPVVLPLAASRLHRSLRFPRSAQPPLASSGHLHAGCPPPVKVSPRANRSNTPAVLTSSLTFRHSAVVPFASSLACRLVEPFPPRSRP
jgi:hypothetical protein